MRIWFKPEIHSGNSGVEGKDGVVTTRPQDPDPVLHAQDRRRLVLVVLDKKFVERPGLVLWVLYGFYRLQEDILYRDRRQYFKCEYAHSLNKVVQCSKNNLNLSMKTEPVTAEADF